MADGDRDTIGGVDWIATGKIRPWTKNPRTGPLEVSDILATLEEGRGITEPLRVRPEEDGSYTALKGNRRHMAASIKGLAELPCIRVYWTDEQALDEALIDEARKALTPLEEAAALAALRARGLDIDAIALRAGRSVRHVRQRLALHDMLGEGGKALLTSRRISLALAEQLAGFQPDAQEGFVAEISRGRDEGSEPLTVRETSYMLRQGRLRLAEGGFSLTDADLVPAAGSCVACPKRTGMQAALFLDGIEREDECTDEKCFKGKKAARAEQVKTSARAQGIAVVSAAGEVKRLFPYGDRLAHDAAFVDLDRECDLIRPPSAQAKNEGRNGGPAKCTGDGHEAPEDGQHNFDDGCEFSAADFEDGESVGDEGTPGCREAFAAGCATWVTCDNGCGAWKELDARPGAPPRGWRPPTWREALGTALARAAPEAWPPAPVVPSLVAEDGHGGAHELMGKKEAVKLLQEAQLVGAEAASREIRDVKPVKKPGELDKFELDRKAKEAGEEAALDAVVAKACKRAVDIKFWRLLAGLCLAGWHNGDQLGRVAARREIDGKAKADQEKAVKTWVAEQKDEGQLRGLVVEMLSSYGYGEEGGQAIVCRFFGVDVDALTAEARTRIKAEAKEKAKRAAAKSAKPAKKTAKASPAPPASPSAPATSSPTTSPTLTEDERERITGEVMAYFGEDASPEDQLNEERIVEALGFEDEADDPAKVRQVLAEMVKSGALVLEDVGGDRMLSVAPPKAAKVPDAAETVQLAGDARKAAEARPCPRCSAKASKVCVSPKGKLGSGWFHVERDPTPPLIACPLTVADVAALAKQHGTEPHHEASSPENVWACITAIRAMPDGNIERATIDSTCEGTRLGTRFHVSGNCVAYATLYLRDAGELLRPIGAGYYWTTWKGAIPIGWSDIVALAMPLKIKPHEGAQSPENVWGCVRELRARDHHRHVVREALHAELASVGTDTVDIAVAYLIKAGEMRIFTKGNTRPENDVLCYADGDAPVKAPARPSLLAAAAKHLPPAKDAPAASTVRSCRCCGCTDAAACVDGAGECEWTELDLCSVCARCEAKALEICHSPQTQTALLKALTSAKGKAKGGGAIETWDKPRAERAIADLETRGGLTGRGGKLVASPG